MFGKILFSELILLLLTLASLLNNGVLCNSLRQAVPHMCDADNDSSEECNGLNTSTIPGTGRLTAKYFILKYSLYSIPDFPQTFTSADFQTKIGNLIYHPGAQWKILIHGFLNSGSTTFPVNVRDAYLRNMEKNSSAKYNVLVVDWGDGACASVTNILRPYQRAAENVKFAGERVGDLLSRLHESKILNVTTDVHLVGHSLGAHVAGHTTRHVFEHTKHLVSRASALDPAGPLFWRNILFPGKITPYSRIHRNRVQFLDVYHTSTTFGSTEEIGDVDFYINGGEHQSSCEIDFYGFNFTPKLKLIKKILQICSHNFATEIFAKSISDDSMKACAGCYSYSEYEKGECDCEDDPVVGEHVVDKTIEGYPVVSGAAYIKTERDTSVGSNYLQMLKNNNLFALVWKGWKALCL